MHPLAVEKIVELCRQREAEGDHPTEPPPSVAILEATVLDLAHDRDKARRQLPALASALRKFAPDLTEQLLVRWQNAAEGETRALEALLSMLRNTQAVSIPAPQSTAP